YIDAGPLTFALTPLSDAPESEIADPVSARVRSHPQRDGVPMRPFSELLSATALVVLASGVACKSDSGVTGPTTLEGQYKGTVAGESSPSLSTSLALTVAASTTGTITPVGAAPITVTGTYVPSTKAVALAGGGYTIAGTIDDAGKLLGTYTHSTAEGSVVAYRHTTANPVTVYCGTYTGDADGIWNSVLRGTSLSGAYDNVDGSDGYFTGTVNGSSVSITDVTASPGTTATGTIAGTTLSGTWSGGGFVGTWTSDATC